MNISQKNREVAVRRWQKIIEIQKSKIPKDQESLRIKSAVCGFLTGDGSVQIRKEKTFFHYQLDFFPDDKIMLRTYHEFIQRLYNKKPSTRVRDNVYQVRLTSRAIVEDLVETSDFGIKKWGFPNELFNVKGAKEAWIKGFFSAEAYVGPRTIKVQTVNKTGMERISQLLRELNIESRIYSYKPKKVNWSPVTILTINKKEARKNYLKNIGFWHSKKTKLLKESLNL